MTERSEERSEDGLPTTDEVHEQYGVVLNRIGYGDRSRDIARVLGGILADLEERYGRKV